MRQVAVFDTNVLLSGVGWKGKPFQCLELARAGTVDRLICQEIASELAEKLKAKLSLSASSGGTVELGPRKLQGSHHFGNTGGSQKFQSGWQFMNQLVGQARVIKIGSTYLYGGGTDQEELHDIVDGLNSADPNDWDIDRL